MGVRQVQKLLPGQVQALPTTLCGRRVKLQGLVQNARVQQCAGSAKQGRARGKHQAFIPTLQGHNAPVIVVFYLQLGEAAVPHHRFRVSGGLDCITEDSAKVFVALRLSPAIQLPINGKAVNELGVIRPLLRQRVSGLGKTPGINQFATKGFSTRANVSLRAWSLSGHRCATKGRDGYGIKNCCRKWPKCSDRACTYFNVAGVAAVCQAGWRPTFQHGGVDVQAQYLLCRLGPTKSEKTSLASVAPVPACNVQGHLVPRAHARELQIVKIVFPQGDETTIGHQKSVHCSSYFAGKPLLKEK